MTSGTSRSLARALGIAPRGVHAFVGAGGKTACIRRLLQECPGAVATTTARLGPTGFGTGLLALFPSAPLLEAGFESLWPARPLTLAVRAGEHLQGPDLGWLESLPRQHPATLLFVEADGAARRLLKLPAAHEPSWPPLPLQRLVIVIGVAALGRPLAEVAHHPERFGSSDVVRQHHVERMLRAYVEAAPPVAPLTILCTGVDGSRGLDAERLVQGCARWVRGRNPALQDPEVPLRLVAARGVDASSFTVWDVPSRKPRKQGGLPGVCGVLLAAGLGERFRNAAEVESKLLVPWRGRPLLEHAAESFARAGFAAWIAVTGHAATPVEKVLRRVARRNDVPLRIVRNPDPACGLGSSVRLAVGRAPRGMGLLFGHGDMPSLRQTTLRRIAATGSSLRRFIVVPEVQGRPANPVFFPADLRQALLRVPDAAGGRSVMRSHPERLFTLQWSDANEFRDIDVPADLLRRRGTQPSRISVLFIGCGDLGTGAAHALVRAGFPVVIVELSRPMAVRRRVAFAEAARSGVANVEGVSCRRIELPQLVAAWTKGGPIPPDVEPGLAEEAPSARPDLGFVPLLVGSWKQVLLALRPAVVIDARLAKAKLRGAVPNSIFHVALGPGHVAGDDCDAVVETLRGPRLGSVIWRGAATEDTGIPGDVGGMTRERVLRAPASGVLRLAATIGTPLHVGQVVAQVGSQVVRTPIAGVLRGMHAEGDRVRLGQKLGDVDPRRKATLVQQISDKAHSVGEGVLEAICTHFGIEVPAGHSSRSRGEGPSRAKRQPRLRLPRR